MLLPPQLLLCIDLTTTLLGPTWERKTQGMRLAGWLAGWLAMMMKLLLSSVNPFLPSVVQQPAQEAIYKGGDKERKYSSTKSATANVGSTIQRCIRGRKNVYICAREEKGGFNAPMRNPSDCPPPPAAATSRPSDLLVFFFFFHFPHGGPQLTSPTPPPSSLASCRLHHQLPTSERRAASPPGGQPVHPSSRAAVRLPQKQNHPLKTQKKLFKKGPSIISNFNFKLGLRFASH